MALEGFCQTLKQEGEAGPAVLRLFFLAEVIEVIRKLRKLCSERLLGVNEIHPYMLKPLDIVGIS